MKNVRSFADFMDPMPHKGLRAPLLLGCQGHAILE